MAQRKPANTPRPGKPGTSKAASSKAASSKAAGSKSGRPAGTATRSGSSAARSAAGRPANRKRNKSIVNQKQTPWGLIITAVVLVLFAGGIVGAVVATSGNNHSTPAQAGGSVDSCTTMVGTNTTSYLNELQCAKDINGVVFKPEANRNHVEGLINYDATPPVGGNHSDYWADCNGTVYPNAIANENAVHMLEHGAVWITYNAKTLPASQVATLKQLVQGQPRLALSPYPNLSTPISLQAWGYQLKLQNASDPRLQRFIDVLRYNPKTTPEYGATCSQPTFKQHPSTFGHPLWLTNQGQIVDGATATSQGSNASTVPSGSGTPTGMSPASTGTSASP